MKPGALLINTARGPIIDIDALYQALRSNKLSGAGIDVMPEEPPSPDDPLIRAYLDQEDWLKGRLLLTPHAAWNSPESRHDVRRLTTETIMGYLTEGKLRNQVNADLMQKYRPQGR
jgi:D-3-phosphoglycerate dehydrogenase